MRSKGGGMGEGREGGMRSKGEGREGGMGSKGGGREGGEGGMGSKGEGREGGMGSKGEGREGGRDGDIEGGGGVYLSNDPLIHLSDCDRGGWAVDTVGLQDGCQVGGNGVRLH